MRREGDTLFVDDIQSNLIVFWILIWTGYDTIKMISKISLMSEFGSSGPCKYCFLNIGMHLGGVSVHAN